MSTSLRVGRPSPGAIGSHCRVRGVPRAVYSSGAWHALGLLKSVCRDGSPTPPCGGGGRCSAEEEVIRQVRARRRAMRRCGAAPAMPGPPLLHCMGGDTPGSALATGRCTDPRFDNSPVSEGVCEAVRCVGQEAAPKQANTDICFHELYTGSYAGLACAVVCPNVHQSVYKHPHADVGLSVVP